MRNIPAEFTQCARSAANASGSRLFSPVSRRDSKMLLSIAKNAAQSWNSLTRINSMNTAILSTETGIQKRIPVSFFFLFHFSNGYQTHPKIKIDILVCRRVCGPFEAQTRRVFNMTAPQEFYGSILVHIAQIWQSHKKKHFTFLIEYAILKIPKEKGDNHGGQMPQLRQYHTN